MNPPVGNTIRQLREAALLAGGGQLGDGELLGAFVTHHDAAALGALVQRHGPMVLGVCRRILRNPHDADDAFQATFLVLARRAAAVAPRDLVGNWLYGVAYRTALEAKRMIARRRRKEKQLAELPHPSVEPAPCTADLQALLDAELSRLPDKLRLPVVLCDLEGRTRREVARQLGIPEGTLSNRLASARRTLARRLARRGLAVTAGTVAAALAQAAAAVPPTLFTTTIRAVLSAGSATTASAVSATVATLTEGVLKNMYLAKLKVLTAILLALGLAAGAGLWASRDAVEAGSPPAPVPVAPAAGPAQAAEQGQKKEAQRKDVLEQAAKAAAAMPGTKDEELHQKSKILVTIAYDQDRAKDRAGAAATFKLAFEAAGAIQAELLRAEALANVGFYQAHAGFIADAQKCVEGIIVKDDKKSAPMQAENWRNRVLMEMASHLAKAGEFKEALKKAEAIPVRVNKYKPKGEDKEVEHRDSMSRDTALKYISEAQLLAGDIAGALKTVKAIEALQTRYWPYRDVIIAQSKSDKAAAVKMLEEWRKELEGAKYFSKPRDKHQFMASTQAAIGDAEGALVWINQLTSEEERAQALLAVSIGMAERDWVKTPKKGK